MKPDVNLYPNLIYPAPETLGWIQTDSGRAAVDALLISAGKAFAQPGLRERLSTPATADQKSLVTQRADSFRRLSGHLAILAVAHHLGFDVPATVWEAAAQNFLAPLFGCEILFPERLQTPPWHSDLWTADIGLNLALVWHLRPPLPSDPAALLGFVRDVSVGPAIAEWIDDRTRIHSLDSMGHNWWSVMVGSALAASTLCGWEQQAELLWSRLIQWFAYPGNRLARKLPFFGEQGDVLESFGYADYAMSNPLLCAFLQPDFKIVPDCLALDQCQQMAHWFKRAAVSTEDGFWPRRIGDIRIDYAPLAYVWQRIALLSGDRELLHLIHRRAPQPSSAVDLLMWAPPDSELPDYPKVLPVRVYPNSGMAFLESGDLSVAVRAGEFWNHNHLDAGSFIFAQEKVVWIDDSGTCNYGRPEYVEHYVMPKAHNVAYAPDLTPPARRSFLEGMPIRGNLLSHACEEPVEMLCVDTLPLSSGKLLRSYRWFIRLGNEALIIWDDLSGYEDHAFDFLLHTTCAVEEKNGVTTLSRDGHTCAIHSFCDVGSEASMTTATMGLEGGKNPPADAPSGECMRWRSTPALRVKFGLAIGTRLRNADWHQLPEGLGWEGNFTTNSGNWRLWFNPLADGRVNHQSPISNWEGYQTDGYALLSHESKNGRSLFSFEASFVRCGRQVLQGSLQRQKMVRTPMPLTSVTPLSHRF